MLSLGPHADRIGSGSQRRQQNSRDSLRRPYRRGCRVPSQILLGGTIAKQVATEAERDAAGQVEHQRALRLHLHSDVVAAACGSVALRHGAWIERSADGRQRWSFCVATGLGFHFPFATQRTCRNPTEAPQESANKNGTLKLPTKTPKVNRSGEYRPGESGFRQYRQGRSGEPSRYNPRKQREFSAKRTSGERVVSGGWRSNGDCDRTVSGSLRRKTLILFLLRISTKQRRRKRQFGDHSFRCGVVGRSSEVWHNGAVSRRCRSRSRALGMEFTTMRPSAKGSM